MEFLIDNWFILLCALAVLVAAGYFVYVFAKRPTSEQLNKVREWLLFAVTQAEKEFGSGTGQIKLRYVYDMFVSKFYWLSKVVKFEDFSLLVDESLEKFRNILSTNVSVQQYVSNGKDGNNG